MAKRFTDTTKWDRQGFREMSPTLKLIWFYLCDNCDHSGIWHVDLGLLSFRLGEEVTEKDLRRFEDKLLWVSKDKVFIPSFVEFQYGTLEADCKAHQGVIKNLRTNGLLERYERYLEEKRNPSKTVLKEFLNSLDTVQDKDQEKDQDQEKEKGSVRGKTKARFNFEQLYADYPCKRGKPDGIEECIKQIRTEEDFELLREAISKYREFITRTPKQGEFIPSPKHFDTFMRKGRWRECLEPDFGSSASPGTRTREQDEKEMWELIEKDRARHVV